MFVTPTTHIHTYTTYDRTRDRSEYNGQEPLSFYLLLENSSHINDFPKAPKAHRINNWAHERPQISQLVSKMTESREEHDRLALQLMGWRVQPSASASGRLLLRACFSSQANHWRERQQNKTQAPCVSKCRRSDGNLQPSWTQTGWLCDVTVMHYLAALNRAEVSLLATASATWDSNGCVLPWKIQHLRESLADRGTKRKYTF